MGICLNGKLPGVLFMPLGEEAKVNNYPFSSAFNPHTNTQTMLPMHVYLDGRQILDTTEMRDIFDNNSLDPSYIAKIEVIRTNQALKTMLRSPMPENPSDGSTKAENVKSTDKIRVLS